MDTREAASPEEESRGRRPPPSSKPLTALAILLIMVPPYALLLQHSCRLFRGFVARVPLNLGWVNVSYFAFWILGATVGWLCCPEAGSRLRVVCIALVLTLAFLTPPFLSTDAYVYTASSRVLTVYGRNPYQISLRELAPSDPFLGFSMWDNRVSLYGPVLLALQLPLGWSSSWAEALERSLGPSFILLPVYVLKLTLLLLHLVNIGLVKRILAGRGVPRREVMVAIWFYALNPMIVLEGIINAHNDLVVATLLLLSVLALEKRGTFRSFCWALVSVFCKYTTALLLPIYALICIGTRRYRTLAAISLVGGIVMSALYLWVRGTPPYARFLTEMSLSVSGSPLAYLARHSEMFRSPGCVRTFQGLGVVSVLVSSWLWIFRGADSLYGIKTLTSALLISHYALAYFFPWYVLPTAALLALLPRGTLRTGTILFVLCILTGYFHDLIPMEYTPWDAGWHFVPLPLFLIASSARAFYARRSAGDGATR